MIKIAVSNNYSISNTQINSCGNGILQTNYGHNINLMNVSIYNTPLCVLDNCLWKFARKSISDWKQTNLDECKKCSKLDECCGVFETSKKYTSNIKAFS